MAHQNQKIKVRRAKEFLHTRIFRPDILYIGQIIREPKEMTKDPFEKGCASPNIGGMIFCIWAGLSTP
jgi:hypothetical protein